MKFFKVKKNILTVAGILFVLPFLAYSQTSSQVSNQTIIGGETVNPPTACDMIGLSVNFKVGQKIISARIKFLEETALIERAVHENRFRMAVDLPESKNMWEKNRLAHIEALGKKAKNEEERHAVSIFGAEVARAIALRNPAYNEIIISFRSDFDRLFNKRRVILTRSFERYEEDVVTAASAAVLACGGSSGSSATASGGNKLRADLAAAKERFGISVKEAEKSVLEFAALREKHLKDIEKVILDFREALDTAKENLLSQLR